jgi:hypothetical protein
MILDEGCAERGCPMHDSRETKGVVFIRKEWVGLTDEERLRVLQFIDPKAVRFPLGFKQIAESIERLLKEKNT